MNKRQPVVPRPCARCGEIFHPGSNAPNRKYCSQACYTEAQKRRVDTTCKACGKAFVVRTSEIRRGGGKYCSRDCWRRDAKSPALLPGVADKISAAKTKHGRSTRARKRQLENAGFSLRAKGETACRNCGRTEHLNLHHAIPRSMWKAGIMEPLNGITLCVRCHMGWHQRYVVIHRDLFTPEEWACISSADLLGQNVEAWLDDRYPPRPLELAA